MTETSFKGWRGLLLAAVLLFLIALAFTHADAQGTTPYRDSQTGTNGQTLTFNNYRADTLVDFEYVFSGAPASNTIVLSGCHVGGTCDQLDSYTTANTNVIRNYSGGKLYDYFTVGITLGGGTNPTLKVNRVSKTAGMPGGGTFTGGTLSSAVLFANFIGSSQGTNSNSVKFANSDGRGWQSMNTNVGDWLFTPNNGATGTLGIKTDGLHLFNGNGIVFRFADTGSGNLAVLARNAGGTEVDLSMADGGSTFGISNTTAGTGYLKFGVLQEAITLSTVGTTTDSTTNLLPANSLILAVGCRVNTLITTATAWQVGDSTTANRFLPSQSGLTVGTQANSVITPTSQLQSAAAKLRITTTGTPGAGVIRCETMFVTNTPPSA